MAQEKRNEGIICPLCGAATTELSCQNCGEDLGLLHEARRRAVQCYNLGLELAQRKSKDNGRRAEECLNLAMAFDARFIEPYIVLGKLCAQQRRYSEAISLWKKALSIDRNSKDAGDCLKGLRSLFTGTDTLRLESLWQGKPLRLGSKVQDSTGRRGKIWRLLPDDESQALTHIVIWTNSFFPQDAMIPVELITGVDGDIVSVGEKLRNLFHRMPKYRSESGQVNNSGVLPVDETKPVNKG
jgi:tetratricopeptide (TPR) repeat protein